MIDLTWLLPLLLERLDDWRQLGLLDPDEPHHRLVFEAEAGAINLWRRPR